MSYQQTPLGIYLTKVYLFAPPKWWAALVKKRECGYETERIRRSLRVLRE